MTNPVRSTPSTERFFLDTEFIESGPNHPIQLLSIGIVAEDGREFYAVNADAVLANANDWVQKNVIPHLGSPRLPLSEIREDILAFIGASKPEFWGYYADYDWVVFCQIFGAMIDLPKGWPMFCRDLKQRCVEVGNPALPKQTSTEHNALNDARWNAYIFDWLASRTTQLPSTPELPYCCEMHGGICPFHKAQQRSSLLEQIKKLPYIKAQRNTERGTERFIAIDDVLALFSERSLAMTERERILALLDYYDRPFARSLRLAIEHGAYIEDGKYHCGCGEMIEFGGVHICSVDSRVPTEVK